MFRAAFATRRRTVPDTIKDAEPPMPSVSVVLNWYESACSLMKASTYFPFSATDGLSRRGRRREVNSPRRPRTTRVRPALLPLTLPMQVTGNLALLADGRVLLSHGYRYWNNFGVDIRLSDDRGATWSPAIRIADCPRFDCGYPSSVQLPNGRMVTAYYTQLSEDFHYEMRTATWEPGRWGTDGRPA